MGMVVRGGCSCSSLCVPQSQTQIQNPHTHIAFLSRLGLHILFQVRALTPQLSVPPCSGAWIVMAESEVEGLEIRLIFKVHQILINISPIMLISCHVKSHSALTGTFKNILIDSMWNRKCSCFDLLLWIRMWNLLHLTILLLISLSQKKSINN